MAEACVGRDGGDICGEGGEGKRSVKYEDVYIKEYEACRDVHKGLEKYFTFYNNRWHHQSLNIRHRMKFIFGSPAGRNEGMVASGAEKNAECAEG
ncbi:MAG: hypothetical protein NG747_01125 [Candidatus Brocadia sp.]|nr:hypothetical protein [Candidatus Brocadia sp.]